MRCRGSWRRVGQRSGDGWFSGPLSPPAPLFTAVHACPRPSTNQLEWEEKSSVTSDERVTEKLVEKPGKSADCNGVARARRCVVCGGLNSPINRFGMVTDADGKDLLVHLGCGPVWHNWQEIVCHHWGVGDRPHDPIGLFLNGRGSVVALHQGCWSQWRAGQQQTSEIDSDAGSTTEYIPRGDGPALRGPRQPP
jgi:hypothetical protein